jgi:hypothetical protein
MIPGKHSNQDLPNANHQWTSGENLQKYESTKEQIRKECHIQLFSWELEDILKLYFHNYLTGSC